MVWLVREDLVRAVELLQEHDARELVGQRHRSERELHVAVVEVQAARSADHEAEILAGLAALLEEPAELDGVELLAVAGQQADVRALRDPAVHVVVLAELDQLEPRMPGEQLLVVRDVVRIRGPEAPHSHHEGAHRCDTSPVAGDPQERHFNIQTTPEMMQGVYANFANVSHSDYEFTITFARVDHEVEDNEVPGVVVSRVSLSPRFMRELIDAMGDNFSKWQTREGIRDLPEYGGGPSPE
jgi:hypothetical protein